MTTETTSVLGAAGKTARRVAPRLAARGHDFEGEVMKVRLDYGQVAPGVYDAMDALDQYLRACGVPQPLLHLVRLRVSQLLVPSVRRIKLERH